MATRDANSPGRRRLSRTALSWVLFGGLLALTAALVVPGISTIQPAYYRRYPGLGERMDHWRTSTHSKVGCIDCHVEPGFEGHLLYGLESVPDFYSQLIQGATTTNLLGAPGRAACQACHTTYRAVSPAGDLLIPHRAHVEVLDLECVVCHENLVHFPNRRGFNRPEMELCLELCHDGDKAGNECSNCHTRKNTPESHESKDWLRVHGDLAAEQDCGECHDWTPDYCSDCHSRRPASHVGNWKKGHAPVAARRDSGCIVCHGREYCDECH